MGLIGRLFERSDTQDAPALHAAIERAVSAVEPLLAQTDGYPERYRQPVGAALEYAQRLAARLPGPVTIDREAYARDAYVHALFPDIDAISAAIASSRAAQQYLRESPPGNTFFALMGMRRVEKNIFGMESAGLIVQRDVAQQAVYFNSHTIESPSSSESRSRELIAMRFFDRLAARVKERIVQRKQNKDALKIKIDALMAHLRTASDADRPALERRLSELMNGLQLAVGSLALDDYASDFDAVMLHPEEYLRLDRVAIALDSMGIRRTGDEADQGILFSELVGYDRRNWTVTIVQCPHPQIESFAEKLDQAYRRLTL